MIRIDTVSGLHGTLVDLRTYNIGESGRTPFAEVIVRRDEVPLESRPYSIHTLYAPDPAKPTVLAAENGTYDLTLEEARSAFRQAVR